MELFVISANYKDRKAPRKWLFRKENEPIIDAVESKCMKATNVVFKNSNRMETGFGCRKVAFCDSLQHYTDLPKEMLDVSNLFSIGFTENQGGYFFDKKTGLELTEVPELYLYPDGSMFTNVNVLEKV